MSDALRSDEMVKRYRDFRDSGAMDNCCCLCEKTAIKEFDHWKIVVNDFPYDHVASRHDMIVPLRHVKEDGLNTEELSEFVTIKSESLQEYDYILEATIKGKSIPDHFHLHLIVGKDK